MTITASRITAGTTREDDREIVEELLHRYHFVVRCAPDQLEDLVTRAKREYQKAALAFHRKWSSVPVHS